MRWWIADKSASTQNWGKARASASTGEVEDVWALLLALRTKAEKASLSWDVLNSPDTEFYMPQRSAHNHNSIQKYGADNNGLQLTSIKHPA